MVQLNTREEVYPHKLRRLYRPFLALAEERREIVSAVAGAFEQDGHRYTIPRFTFCGPPGSTPPLRIGIFAVVHGDEPAGALALETLFNQLADDPADALGYELIAYPVCNPTGYEDETRFNRAGFDLNREFWRESPLPEIQILEHELRTQRFDGIIALHADDTSEGLYGYSQGRLINEQLLRPALRACAGILPLNEAEIIDGFRAHESVICHDCYKGILTAPPELRPQPFEIIFETPARAPLTQQAEAASCALRALLSEYRRFIAQGINL